MKTLAVVAPFAIAAVLTSESANACGGCFIPPASNTVVSGHRMALAVSTKRTVLWDQIQYQGSPEDFSWVLPIKPGARIEEASAEWFETLEATTITQVQGPPLNCGGGGLGFGCGASAASEKSAGGDPIGNGGVNVVHQETVGPYDSVTLSSKDAGALSAWLESHGYDIPAEMKPIIGAYVTDGFDFIALRLTPGNGVNLMKPVRVITDGASPVLPLRMVSAGTGPFTSIVLYVLGEGRWAPSNFPSTEVPLGGLVWNGKTNDSNYAELRASTLGLLGGLTWITTYAQPHALFGGSQSEDGTGDVIGYLYAQQIQNTPGGDMNAYYKCQETMNDAMGSGVVVDPCDPDTKVCGTVGASEIDARKFTCGSLDDLSAALVGMHPNDVWVTRLEANLPHSALATDLELAAAVQTSVDRLHVAENATDYSCPGSTTAPLGSGTRKGGTPGNGTPLVVVALGALAAAFAARRRGFLRA